MTTEKLIETENKQFAAFKKRNEGAWVITWGNPDLELEDDADKSGPYGITMSKDDIKDSPDSHEFRMFEDCEMVPDYQGMCYLPDGFSEAAFNPLENFGTPNTGCIHIEYKDKVTGEWGVL